MEKNTASTDKNNKKILILGASSETGVDLIERIGAQFDEVVAHYGQNADRLLELRDQKGIPVKPVQADFSSPEDTDAFVRRLREAYPEFSHIVHLSAGRLEHLKFARTVWASYERDLNIGLQSAVKILQAYLPGMVKRHFGRVVFLLSSVTENTAPGYLGGYVPAKYALKGLMESLSAEFSSKNIHINAVSPYMMDTGFLSQIPETVASHMMELNPFGKPVEISQVTRTVAFLLSDQADALYGQNLIVKGRP